MKDIIFTQEDANIIFPQFSEIIQRVNKLLNEIPTFDPDNRWHQHYIKWQWDNCVTEHALLLKKISEKFPNSSLTKALQEKKQNCCKTIRDYLELAEKKVNEALTLRRQSLSQQAAMTPVIALPSSPLPKPFWNSELDYQPEPPPLLSATELYEYRQFYCD
ncbi:hypothetical protein [Legionella cardiaca]|uniref:Uncharacterized protein n=1 Tax=Legionella cardiaca TaxID=1071983 RepID=A0ABY8APB0_9GAMM|nr:hypothetical protein [Legionella cardiaca]WED42544.1 hypothetical protein PXX05_11580 [Legionella cardiaca]